MNTSMRQLREFRWTQSPEKRRWALWGGLGLALLVITLALSALPAGYQAAPDPAPTFEAPDQALGPRESGPEVLADARDSTWTSVLWPLAALMLVLGLLYASLWAIRRWGPQARGAEKTHSPVELRTSLRLANNQTLHVVRFGPEILLLGATPAGITRLASSPAEPAGAFGRLVDQFLEEEQGAHNPS